MHKHLSIIILLSAFLSGCANNSGSTQGNQQMGNLLLAEPAPMNQRSQLAIARYSHILANTDLEDEQRAQLLHQRGTLYDSVGLSGLAQYDFNLAIQLKPDLAEAYNSMGVHYTQQMDFIQAYEAFDASLDINPDMEFAFLNRGIALYYGGRPDLAVRDFDTFYNRNASDPYRALWSYLASSEIDKPQAMIELAKLRKNLDESNWATQLVDLYLEKTTESELLGALIRGVTSQQQLTDRLCEAYFYLGKYHSARGNRGIASNYFKLALSTNVFEYVEHRYARLELNLLRDEANKNLTDELQTQ
ncbi:lipoprotein NlpI [Paraglaciecola arctica]|uniref:Lipoprotein NlpI n=1 Tax=Paraglaciecola arctica BSs20135 TaxID=493475 RepID=K6YQM5_9ALTE|nr:lipoprotein NlpI [Paraglaciecola arctica]GAC20472.1 lipoprotein NlpI [Paraglaciecola arctica BSs20135]|tara:strand:- start:17321 stop:18229 length:909 start_codon:yes stop_codon:yes gene_type:complete